jgi:CDP-diacylglycerol--serine O-phosphatidyltransferase
MSAFRLAKFNIDERQGTDFLGVATPTAAMICGALCCYAFVTPGSLLAAWAEAPWFLPTLSVLLGVLLVSEIPMFGMKVKPGHKLLDGKRICFLALCAGVLLAVVLTGRHISLAVFGIFVIYILENLAIHDAAVLKGYAHPKK